MVSEAPGEGNKSRDELLGVSGERSPALRIVRFGEPATAALRDAIREVKERDPLAPVTVVVPSAHAGVTLRRALAAGGGLVNVQFITMPQLAELLAAPLLAARESLPLSPAVRFAAIRMALDDAQVLRGGSVGGASLPTQDEDRWSGWLGAMSPNPATIKSLTATFAELSDLPEAVVDRLASLGSREAEVVRAYRQVQSRCSGLVDEPDVLAAATAAVRDGARSLAAVGRVIVHLPRRVGHRDLALIEALAAHDRVVVLVGGATHDSAGSRLTTGISPPDDQLISALSPVDAWVDQLVSTLSRSLGPAVAVGPATWRDAGVVGPARDGMNDGACVVRAPDPDVEVRVAVRNLLRAIRADVPPDRIAVATRMAVPYFALIHEQLAFAGVPHNGPSGLRLAQTVAGRVLLGGLALLGDDLPRVDLLRWLRTGPFCQPDGSPLPVDSFERIAREAGIAGGREQWIERLRARAGEIESRIVQLVPARDLGPEDRDGAPAPGLAKVRKLARRADHIRTLTFVVEWLGAMTDELMAAASWDSRAGWARRFLIGLLGPPEDFRPSNVDIDPPSLDAEVQAYTSILAVLDSLETLAGSAQESTLDAFLGVVEAGLDQPAPQIGVSGRGVFVGSIADLVGADHDLVVIVGMAEGAYPPRDDDDPILPESVRARLGEGVMASRRASREDEHRDHLAAMASGARAILSFSRADTTTRRELLPSRWLLDQVRSGLGLTAEQVLTPSGAAPPAHGLRPRSPMAAGPQPHRRRLQHIDNELSIPDDKRLSLDDLDLCKELETAQWWLDVPSFASLIERSSGVDDCQDALTSGERTAAVMHGELAAAGRASPGPTRAGDAGARMVVPAGRAGLLRGIDAAGERRNGSFGPFTGMVGPDSALAFGDDRVGSATSFETWATCPFRYFLRYVLDLRGLDERAESDEINPLDRGTYIHKVLEEFVGEPLRTGADLANQQLTADELARLRRIALDASRGLEAEGRTGRPLLWSLRYAQLLRRLEQIFEADLAHRKERGVVPVAVELAFGNTSTGGGASASGPGAEPEAAVPVVVTLDNDRSLAFRGLVDRVDRSPDGDRLVVIDYKTGRDGGYEDLRPGNGRQIDIVCRGRHLQLALYALAARNKFGSVPVTAFFWFVENPTKGAFQGGDIDDLALARLRQVLGTVVEGIESGLFPARPGEPGYFGFANCGFCDFDRICPSSRGELWEAIRSSESLGAYTELAEGEHLPSGGAGASTGAQP